MLGEEIKELNEEIKDAVGEITNMISGQARRWWRTRSVYNCSALAFKWSKSLLKTFSSLMD